MKETELAQNFKRLINEKARIAKIPVFYYKIPDTGGTGGLRPFDSILLIAGKLFAIEFKVGKAKLKPHQKFCLGLIDTCGGRSVTVKDTSYKEVINDIIAGAITARDILSRLKQNFKKDGNDGLSGIHAGPIC